MEEEGNWASVLGPAKDPPSKSSGRDLRPTYLHLGDSGFPEGNHWMTVGRLLKFSLLVKGRVQWETRERKPVLSQ